MPKYKAAGQPTKLNPKMQAAFIRLVAKGTYLRDVCDALGIHYQTYRNWMIWGEEYAQAKRPKAKHRIYFEFFDAVNKATAKLKLETVHQIRQISLDSKDWRGLAWYLERRFQDEYGRKRLEVTGKDGGPIRTTNLTGNIPLDNLSESELADAYAQLLRDDDEL
jgi:hypothetical protein